MNSKILAAFVIVALVAYVVESKKTGGKAKSASGAGAAAATAAKGKGAKPTGKGGAAATKGKATGKGGAKIQKGRSATVHEESTVPPPPKERTGDLGADETLVMGEPEEPGRGRTAEQNLDEDDPEGRAPYPRRTTTKKPLKKGSGSSSGSSSVQKPYAPPSGGTAVARPGYNPEDEDAEPIPDPFHENRKWSAFVRRVDAMSASLKSQATTIAQLLSSANGEYSANTPEYLKNFLMGFSKQFSDLSRFFTPALDEIADHAPYTVINPAITLTNLEKLNEWARNPPAKPLDKDRLKWVEVNGFAITVHYIFDRLDKQVADWGILEVGDAERYGYPTWLKEISGSQDESKPTFELQDLKQLAQRINEYIEQEDKRHMMRSLEKILRNHLMGWDPESDYNIYCYGNNEFGIVHDVFDLLTDAAMYLAIADMKNAALQVVLALMKEWDAQNGGEENDPAKQKPASDISDVVETAFKEMDERIARKIKIAALADTSDNILPGPTTYKCDLSPNNQGEEFPTQPPGHESPAGVQKPQIHPIGGPHQPGGSKPDGPPTSPKVYPVSQWGKPPPEPLSPRVKGDSKCPLDPQSGPDHPHPIGYIDGRPPTFEAFSFSGAYTGYLEAEMVLNPDGSCKSTCPDFRRPFPTCENKTIDCPGYRDSFCEPGKECLSKPSCDSTARDCIRTNFEVRFCPSKKPGRIYDWVNYNGTFIGKDAGAEDNDDCPGGELKAKERWEMDFGVIVNAPQYCEVCLCKCDGPMTPDGIHFFDLQPVVAKPGFVITSVKFTQKDNVVRLEAEEGKLLENGYIDQESVKWIDSSRGSAKDSVVMPRLGGPGGFKKMGLDMVYATMNSVVTGIKFNLEGDELHLNIQTTPIQADGSLGSAGEWVGGNYPPPEKILKKVQIGDKVNSQKQLGPGQPFNLPLNNKVIQFDASSLENDAGQAVIPMFDAQAVRHHTIRKPLSAVGIMHKSKRGYGGFLTPAISPYRKSYMTAE